MPVAAESKDMEICVPDADDYMDVDMGQNCNAKNSGNTGNTQTDIFMPEQSAPLTPNDTIIVFDWDDTLLPSSFLSSKGYRVDAPVNCPEVEKQLREHAESVISVLTLALKYGHVHVITNAEAGWVQLSARTFMPAVVPLLQKLTILSARTTYEPQFPDSPFRWKLKAFRDRIMPNRKLCYRNVISFGDSHVEREAVRTVTRNAANVRTKSVKFAERPSMEQLRRQIELVSNCFQYIFSHDQDLDLMLTISLIC